MLEVVVGHLCSGDTFPYVPIEPVDLKLLLHDRWWRCSPKCLVFQHLVHFLSSVWSLNICVCLPLLALVQHSCLVINPCICRLEQNSYINLSHVIVIPTAFPTWATFFCTLVVIFCWLTKPEVSLVKCLWIKNCDWWAGITCETMSWSESLLKSYLWSHSFATGFFRVQFRYLTCVKALASKQYLCFD